MTLMDGEQVAGSRETQDVELARSQRRAVGWLTACGGAAELSEATRLGLKVLVRSVAEGRILRVFAQAPGHCFGLIDLNLQGRELRSLVGTVAKGLLLGFPASAPMIGSLFGLLNQGGFLSNDWSLHKQFDG